MGKFENTILATITDSAESFFTALAMSVVGTVLLIVSIVLIIKSKNNLSKKFVGINILSFASYFIVSLLVGIIGTYSNTDIPLFVSTILLWFHLVAILTSFVLIFVFKKKNKSNNFVVSVKQEDRIEQTIQKEKKEEANVTKKVICEYCGCRVDVRESKCPNCKAIIK